MKEFDGPRFEPRLVQEHPEPGFIWKVLELQPGDPRRFFPFLWQTYPVVVRVRGAVVVKSFLFIGTGEKDATGKRQWAPEQHLLQVDVDKNDTVLQIFSPPPRSRPCGWVERDITEEYTERNRDEWTEIWQQLGEIKACHRVAASLLERLLSRGSAAAHMIPD